MSWREEKKRRIEHNVVQRLLAYIHTHACSLSMRRLTDFLNLSRAGLYRKRVRHEADETLKEHIEAVLAQNPAYGHRRIAISLHLGRKRIRRVMKKYALKPYKRKARWRKRRDERRAPTPYTNLIKSSCPIQPSIVWVSDFTYIRHKSRFLYLATFMDRFTREIVGWHISTRHTKELVIAAFWDGFKATGKQPRIVHSDQGVEYTSHEYAVLMSKLDIQISMSKKSSPWENAYQESFYNNFKTDLGLEFDRFESVGELVEAIHHTIVYYNNQRIHTTLKMPPAHYRMIYTNQVLDKVVSKKGT